MQCTQCGQLNQSAKFCVKCGTKLPVAATEVAATSEAVNYDHRAPADPIAASQQPASQQSYQPNTYANQPVAPSQPNPQLQQAKQISKQYFSYFLEVLKSPVKSGQASNAGHMVNGLITIILFSLILPLIAYFQIRESVKRFGGFMGDDLDVPFGAVVIKPFVFLILVVMMVNSIIFLVLKMGNVVINYREVTARFGTFMIPSVTFFFIGLLFTLMGMDSEILAWVIGAGMFSWFVAICFTIYSFKRDHTSGLDAFYGVIITYAGSILLLYLFGDNVLASLLRGLNDI
ncbi:zinc ribbon domain-containing protein [Cohnella cholangitidis]|uniref:Zinc ribbon domain-containing protein n=1 Tax=Cohnella cholangitidis TaxID=2598458 RepID=A0A7G5C1C4_9BACL|nr:zinc ribbon domain-containing protein [Cohnella cholangitidis]QMV43008.1 zinc ribbon domain-containing protein [Cohnella cholangitidis]